MIEKEGKIVPKLHFITHEESMLSPCQQAKEACRGGIKCVQIRMKGASIEEVKKAAILSLRMAADFNTWVIINDHVELAKEVEADGVHLGESDMHPAKAREILGKKYIIGGTANSMERILEIKDYVDYIGLGPYRHTETKKNLSPVLGLEGYKSLIQQCKKNAIYLPIIAIGGIGLDDIPVLMGNGVYGVAVSSAIALSEDAVDVASDFAALTSRYGKL